MHVNIHRSRCTRALTLCVLAAAGASRGAAQACPPESGAASAAGWAAYGAGALREAKEQFTRAAALCSTNLDAAAGLGYVALRTGGVSEADSIFRSVTARDPRNGDAWTGRALTARRRGDLAAALAAARTAVGLDSANGTARQVLDALDPDWSRPARRRDPRPAALQLVARTRGAAFEVRSGDAWRPIWIKGVNLGVALPGRFASEFPADSALYAGWLATIAAMNANAVRVYTFLPPAFYRAFRAWNLGHPAGTLWLVHGVWAELPPGHDFDDAAWKESFRAEMRTVVDLVHGSARIPARRGHASGRYDADVSPWTLAFIVGREWEPFAVSAYAARHPGSAPFHGRFLAADTAPAMDRWMAEQCDYMLAYEFDGYHALRPIAYTNWPTLDPLVHPTEATAAEESRWRLRSGRSADAPTLEYENDAIALDASLVRPTAANPAGWFASYHAYPYYPDFMLHDPGYDNARSSEGRSNYFGYIRDLRRHHDGIPLLVAEYGVPSSRGIAHRQPQGWSHGGLDETEMASIDARLTRELHEAGTAGGILFAWLDEWFKRNWLVMDFEIPAENTRRWHNVMDAEQNYGILGLYAGDSASRPVLGGDPRRWHGPDDAPLTIRSDPSYVYLALPTGAAFSWGMHGVEIGISTWDDSLGQHLLPRSGHRSATGFEFVVDLAHPDSGAIRVLPEYNRHSALDDSGDDRGRFLRRPVTIADRTDGRFDRMQVITNRARFGRDGTFFPASQVDRGVLRFGTESASSLSDWYYDAEAHLIELRIPWDLLNVSDPSSRTLLFEREARGGLGTVTAGAFHFTAVTYRRDRDDAPAVTESGPWRWKGWEAPAWYAKLKPVYAALRATWAAIP